MWYKKLRSTLVLDFIFSLDEVITKYKTKPLDYLSYLLKYSGQDSLISVLKRYKLASKIDVGPVTSTKDFTLFAISLTLTEEGFNKISGVIDLTFNYLNLIKDSKVNEAIYREIFNISRIQFKFLEKKRTYGEYLSSLAMNMFNYDNNEVIHGDFIHSNYDDVLIQSFVNNLTVENSIIMVGSSEFPTENLKNMYFYKAKNETEVWYGTNFIQQKLSQEYMKSLSILNNTEHFALRGKNEFITAETQIRTCLDENVIIKINPLARSMQDRNEFYCSKTVL